MRKWGLVLAGIAITCLSSTSFAQLWWRTWDTHPKVPKIPASAAKKLVLAGEKAVFVYCGYAVPESICGSVFIPYTLVPPSADGSRINLAVIPKDAWIFCYCT